MRPLSGVGPEATADSAISKRLAGGEAVCIAAALGDHMAAAEGDQVGGGAADVDQQAFVGGQGTRGVAARISRILSFGVTARVELDGLNGSTGQVYEVEITREEVGRLGLREGQSVRLVPSHLRVFERDGANPIEVPAPNWEI